MVPKIHVEDIQFTTHPGGRLYEGVADLAIPLMEGGREKLSFVMISFALDDHYQSVTLAANRLSADSYYRVCSAIGVEP